MSYGASELILVDVHSDIGVLSELLSIIDLEAVAYCRTDTSQQEVDVSRAVGGTELDRLLIGVALLAGRFEGVDDAGISTSALQPRGTRTRAERLRSPQHTVVGAS